MTVPRNELVILIIDALPLSFGSFRLYREDSDHLTSSGCSGTVDRSERELWRVKALRTIAPDVPLWSFPRVKVVRRSSQYWMLARKDSSMQEWTV